MQTPVRPALLLSVSFLVATPAFAQSLGYFQNTVDGRTYEIRRRGDTGLNIYAPDGIIAATLNKKRSNDHTYRGHTQKLATQCPASAGNIQVLSVRPERIQARVELPTMLSSGKPVCGMMVMAHWQYFDLIKQNVAPAPAPAPPAEAGTMQAPVAAPAQPGNVIERAGIRFEVEHCDREDTRIVCHLALTNTLNNDFELWSPSQQTYAADSKFHQLAGVDQLGEQLVPAVSDLGNSTTFYPPGALLVPGLRSPLRLVFENTQREVNALVRLTIPIREQGNRWIDVTFSNIPVRDADAPQTGTGSPSGKQALSRNGVKYSLEACRRAGSDLECRIRVQNSPADLSVNWLPGESYAIDQSGNRATGYNVLIDGAEPQWNKPLPANAKAMIEVKFRDLSSIATNLVRLEVKGNDGANLALRFTNVPVQNQ